MSLFILNYQKVSNVIAYNCVHFKNFKDVLNLNHQNGDYLNDFNLNLSFIVVIRRFHFV